MPRILLAEDDDALRQFMTVALRRAGHDVDGVSDGAAALAALERERYDLVLTDLIMPGCDGVDLIDQAADRYGTVKALLVSNHVDEIWRKVSHRLSGPAPLSDAARQALTALGASDVLPKPFLLGDLVDRIDAKLNAA